MSFDDFQPFVPEEPAPEVSEAPPIAFPSQRQARAVAPPAAGAPRRGAPVATRARAGLGIIAAAAGVGLGFTLGGPPGAMAGLAGVGALRNLYRAQGLGSPDPAEKADAARCVAICVVGFAIAGYLGYKAWGPSKERD